MPQPAIHYPEMQKSVLVLYDMAAFYLPIHNQDWKRFFSYYPILGMVEGLIYQVEVTMERSETPDANKPNLWPNQEPIIAAFLTEHQLNTSIILHYLAEVGDYFQTVHHLMNTDTLSLATIRQAMETRPADIRLLHAILLQLMGQPHNNSLFELLWPLEVLLDLKANLTEYADDLVTGHYNSYHMFVKLYGEQAPRYLETEQQRYQAMLQKRLQSATAEQKIQLQRFMTQHEGDYPSVPIPAPVATTE